MPQASDPGAPQPAADRDDVFRCIVEAQAELVSLAQPAGRGRHAGVAE
jgi:hypothetical protein